MERTEGSSNQILGELTFTALTEIGDLFRASETDAWGVSRTPFSPVMARLSAEIAADGYGLDIKPWMAAGWDDCTFVVEDRIVVLDHDSESRLAAVESEWRRRRAKSLMQGVNPISDLKRAIRQLLVTDLGKAIIMTHLLPDGRAVVAVSFIGTTQKYFDWFSSFKFQQDTGMHFGFLELARRFDAQSTRILLPKLAAAMGEETMSLADAVLEAGRPGGRVSLWVSGHSQGGALAQTYTHLLHTRGVDNSRIHAYTFAAPTVASGSCAVDAKAYPIYNIINADDIVPRIGAEIRLGMDCVYHPSEAFRGRHYRVEQALQPAFSRAMHLSRRVQSTQDAICFGVALVRLIREADADPALEAFFTSFAPYLSAIRRVNISLVEMADFLEGKLLDQHRSLHGAEPEADACAEYQEALKSMVDTFGPKETMDALIKVLHEPHHIRPGKHDELHESPYIAITRRHLTECERGIWLPSGPAPRCVSADGETLLPKRYSAALPPRAAPRLPEGQAETDDP